MGFRFVGPGDEPLLARRFGHADAARSPRPGRGLPYLAAAYRGAPPGRAMQLRLRCHRRVAPAITRR